MREGEAHRRHADSEARQKPRFFSENRENNRETHFFAGSLVSFSNTFIGLPGNNEQRTGRFLRKTANIQSRIFASLSSSIELSFFAE
jgi:hypothetical protein